MADVPVCPNFREGSCERSDTVFTGESRDGKAYTVVCRTCKLLWLLSKAMTKAEARHQNRMKKHHEATEREKMMARQGKKFYMPGKRFA